MTSVGKTVGISSTCCPLSELSSHVRPSAKVAPVVRLRRCVEVWRRSDIYTRWGAMVTMRDEMLRVDVSGLVLRISRQPVRPCNTIHRLPQFMALQTLSP
eukprot:178106-Chlamydomonas_euryale.AAC.3